MSAPIPITNSPIQNDWRKRPNIDDFPVESSSSKRQRFNYYFVLASESSQSEDERSESIDSIQDRETDLCKDTTDTDTKSEQSENIEYEIVSFSEEENPYASGSSTGEDALIATGTVAVALAADNSNIDVWITEDDDDNNSESSLSESQLLLNKICKKCKTEPTVSEFFLCSHCYQIRKNCFPPRPRRKKTKNSHNNKLISADQMSVFSHDSGLASSQELQTISTTQKLETFAWDKVVVPENLLKSSQEGSSSFMGESSQAVSTISNNIVSLNDSINNWAAAASEMCIMCNVMPKNGIFVHSTGGHLCCCYSCAVKYWTKSKRCAFCNLKVKNVIKAFFS